MEIIVVDDASFDRTPVIAGEAGSARFFAFCPTSASAAPCRPDIRLPESSGCDLVVQIDGDGQHDPKELPLILEPVLDGRADIVIGSRFAGAGKYRAPPVRRLGMRIFATFVSLLVGKSLSDTSSSFRAVNRRALSLFAVDYPHGYLETIEATVMAVRYGLRIEEVPVRHARSEPRDVPRSRPRSCSSTPSRS